MCRFVPVPSRPICIGRCLPEGYSTSFPELQGLCVVISSPKLAKAAEVQTAGMALPKGHPTATFYLHRLPLGRETERNHLLSSMSYKALTMTEELPAVCGPEVNRTQGEELAKGHMVALCGASIFSRQSCVHGKPKL